MFNGHLEITFRRWLCPMKITMNPSSEVKMRRVQFCAVRVMP